MTELGSNHFGLAAFYVLYIMSNVMFLAGFYFARPDPESVEKAEAYE